MSDVAARTQKKITQRLMPFLLLLYITAYVDRINVGFAGLDMTKDLGFSNEVFGFGSGIFFLGYCLLEIPGAMLVEVWSARRWITGIMVLWGVLAGFTGLIHNATEFNIIRFLLGFAEGGFFPSIVVYLTHWYRNEERGRAIAMFMAAIPVSAMIGAPISGLLLQLHWLGMPGWRWLLILEGLPALVGGIVTFFYLPDWPKDARWLAPEEREWITSELARETRTKKELGHHHPSILMSIRQPAVLAVAFSYFLINTSGYGLVIWLPKIVQRFSGLDTLKLSLLVAIPYLVSVPAMIVNGWHSDRTGERRWHAAITALLAGVGLALSQVLGGSPTLALAALTVASVGIMAYYPAMWAMPTQLLSERSAAASYGFINLIANFGGFVGPYAIGFLTDRTGTYAAGVYLLVVTAALGSVVIALAPHRQVKTVRASVSIAAQNG
ncbi:MAG TPA: MFS transporter [Bryobacteraceae bacterium]|jgi:ACS family tartrate transporter-like MFS transporter|nr:MFS transporter [Bryobacteraceae bacterium]